MNTTSSASASQGTLYKAPRSPSRPTQFGRLAQRYYPDRGYKRAVALFREELRITGGLMDALVKVGYTENSRVLSPRQVRVIEEYLGESD